MSSQKYCTRKCESCSNRHQARPRKPHAVKRIITTVQAATTAKNRLIRNGGGLAVGVWLPPSPVIVGEFCIALVGFGTRFAVYAKRLRTSPASRRSYAGAAEGRAARCSYSFDGIRWP